jgi:hypothetical protein
MPGMARSKIEFLKPWCDFVPGQGDKFLRELRCELSPGHLLEGLALSPVGHSGAADDAIFEAEDGRIFQVHLTFSHHIEQTPLPSCQVYSNIEEWVQSVMRPANQEYLS